MCNAAEVRRINARRAEIGAHRAAVNKELHSNSVADAIPNDEAATGSILIGKPLYARKRHFVGFPSPA